MSLKSFVLNIIECFSPDSYRELSSRSIWSSLKYASKIFTLAFVIMFVLFIPSFFSIDAKIDKTLTHFSTATVASDFSLKDSFNILSDPLVRVESVHRNLTNEKILITDESIQYKSFFWFGKTVEKPFPTAVDVAQSSRLKSLAVAGFFFLSPSVVFWSFLLFIVYFAIVILGTVIVGWILNWTLRLNIMLSAVLKCGIYASTVLILLQLLLLPFFRLILLPLIAYWLLFLIVLLLMKDHTLRNDSSSNSGSGKSNDIFNSSSSSSGFSKKKTSVPIQDSYDVDERGNLKTDSSLKKKKRSFDDDNDGYVMLK